jgi:uncharacterized membrane protein
VNWPHDRTIEPPATLTRPKTESAEVVGLNGESCRVPGSSDCVRVTARLTSGEHEGEQARFTIGDVSSDARLELGDKIRVYENQLPRGAVLGGVKVDRYGFADFERGTPLLWLAVAFALLVVVTGRLQGVRALLGLVGSLAVVVFFVVPAILDGRSPTQVAFFGALAVMFVTIPLAHGLSVKTVAACLGTAASLLLTLILADVFTDLAHLTGLASDEAIFLRAAAGDISIQGLCSPGWSSARSECWTTSRSARPRP